MAPPAGARRAVCVARRSWSRSAPPPRPSPWPARSTARPPVPAAPARRCSASRCCSASGSAPRSVAERAVRPLFPLASLLQMSLLFPDRAPSRLLTALRAGSTCSAKDLLEDPEGDVDQRMPHRAILVLVSALGHHDRITRGHCERVRTYADLMATRLELSSHDADRLRWAALLHDIGKLRVAYATLNKKGRLDADEWEAIKRHPADGAALIAPMAEWLGSWADAVPQHHERVDGKGYPHGLSGDAIHQGARIIAIMDAFDVMTASRSYKRPVSSAAARSELQRCAGTQFDPTLVEAFLDLRDHRAGWWAGAIAALLQVPGLTTVARLPGRIAAASAHAPPPHRPCSRRWRSGRRASCSWRAWPGWPRPTLGAHRPR